jgi:hypothetical protein
VRIEPIIVIVLHHIHIINAMQVIAEEIQMDAVAAMEMADIAVAVAEDTDKSGFCPKLKPAGRLFPVGFLYF